MYICTQRVDARACGTHNRHVCKRAAELCVFLVCSSGMFSVFAGICLACVLLVHTHTCFVGPHSAISGLQIANSKSYILYAANGRQLSADDNSHTPCCSLRLHTLCNVSACEIYAARDGCTRC